MKKTLSCIKQDIYTFFFYSLRLSCSHSSHPLRHPSLKLSTSSLTLRQRAQPFLSGKYPFFRGLHIGKLNSLYPASSLFKTQQQLTHPQVKSSSFPLWKNHVSQGLLFCNVLTLSCLDSLWYGTHPCYSLNPYVHLYYLRSIYIAKDHRYPKYFISCLFYFYNERPLLSKIFYSMCGLFLWRKTAALQMSVARDFGGVRYQCLRLQTCHIYC